MIRRVLLVLISLMTALAIASAFQTADATEQDALRQASQIGVSFAIPDNEHFQDSDKVSAAIEAAANTTGVNVLRPSFGFDAAKRPVTRLYWLQNGPTELDRAIRLIRGRWPTPVETHSDQILLASGGMKPDTTGRINDIWNNDRITVEGFRAAFDSLPVSGTYRVEGARASEFPAALATELNAIVDPPVVSADQLRPKSAPAVASTRGQSFLTLAALAVITATILLAVYRQMAETKRIGVFTLHGYSLGRAWLHLTALPVLAASSATLVVGLIGGSFIPGITPEAAMRSVWDAFVAVVAVLAASAVAMLLLARMRIADAIKNRRSTRPLSILSMVIKTGFAVVLIVALAGIGSEFAHYANQRDALRFWAKTADYGVFTPRLGGADLADIAAGTDSAATSEAKELYESLNRDGAIYIQARQFEDPDPNADEPDLANAAYRAIMVNPNYLRAFPIRDRTGNEITVDEDEQDWIVLAPDSMLRDENAILAHFQQLRTGTEGQPGMIGQTDMSGAPIPPRLRAQKVRVGFYAAGQDIFSFSPKAGRSRGYMLASPILEVMTQANSTIDDRAGTIAGGGDAALKVRLHASDTKRTMTDLAPLLAKLHLDDNLRSLQTMTDFARGELKYSEDGMRASAVMAGFLAIGLLALGLQSAVLLFDSLARKTTVRRLFGYSFVARNRELIIIASSIAALQLAAALGMGMAKLTLFSQVSPSPNQIALSFILVLGIESMVAWLCLRRLETRRTLIVLKGEF